MKKILILSLALVMAASIFAMPTFAEEGFKPGATYVLCDNFGREWSLDVTGGILRGCRDLNNELGCGCLPAYGILGGGRVAIAVLDTTSDSCISTYWEGSVSGNSIVGSVYNENGYFGSFTLSVCSGDSEGLGTDGADPSAQ